MQNQQDIRPFIEKYLQQNNCHIIESAPSYIITQLSIDVDKDLLNRPFYWMYVEKANIQPHPAKFCFVFDPNTQPKEVRGEYIFHGSSRFKQILDSAQKYGRFVRLYQKPIGWEPRGAMSKPYDPYLVVHFKVSYICDQQRDRLCCLGIHMQNGKVYDGFFKTLQTVSWTTKLPEQRHVLRPHLTIPEAVGELEYYLHEQLKKEDASWADQAEVRLEKELQQLDVYYPGGTLATEEAIKEKQQRRQELFWQYQPRIEVNLVNAGLFYMERK